MENNLETNYNKELVLYISIVVIIDYNWNSKYLHELTSIYMSCVQLTRKLQQLLIKVVVTAYSTIEGII